MEWLKTHTRGTLILAYIQPGASRDGIVGVFDKRVKIAIKAPPREGEANAALVEFISKLLGVSKRKVHLMRGESSRQKDLVVELPLNDVLLVFKGLI